jgi:DnaK suppressor protein
MSPPTPEGLRARYGPRIAAEIAALMAASGGGRAEHAQVAPDRQSPGRLARLPTGTQPAPAAAHQARRGARLRALQAALERLGGEDFGWCQECGEPLAPLRLDLDPTLTRCIACAR